MNEPAQKPRRRRVPAADSVPHSWGLVDWPESVWPGDGERARRIIQTRRSELASHGAVTRIGRRLVILGDGWMRFLFSRMHDVDGFDANNPPEAMRARKRRDESQEAGAD